MNYPFSPRTRRTIMTLSPYIVNQVHYRNPWVVACWSAAFPGFGHMMLCKYLTGFLLMGWEFFINVESHLNLAIEYSMLGQFDKAKAALDERWFLLYVGIYLFSIWNCYCICLDLNQFYILADRKDSPISTFYLGPLEINYLYNRNPWWGVVWSFFAPGLGHLQIHRLPTGVAILACYVTSVYAAHVLPAVQSTMMGHFQEAVCVLKPQWFLFLPSIYVFAAYDTYVHGIEVNKLFKVEQSRYLREEYGTSKLALPN